MRKIRILVTGGAGFIGSNLVNSLAKVKVIKGVPIEKIVVIDNLFLGKREFIQSSLDSGQVDFYKQDLLDFDATLRIFKKYRFDLVFHFSANSDISYGSKHTDWDLQQGTLATYNILESMRLAGVKKIVFSSTSAIYGEASVTPTPEDYGPLLPISFYGASKLACEGLISAFCHNYDFQAWIFRFANIVGQNSTHGVLVDFIRKLKKDPTRLEVLGDGKQRKPYLHIQDCLEGIVFGLTKSSQQINFFNLASEGVVTVDDLAAIVIQGLDLHEVKVDHTGGDRGWKGDVARVSLSPDKLTTLGWRARLTSHQAVVQAVAELVKQL